MEQRTEPPGIRAMVGLSGCEHTRPGDFCTICNRGNHAQELYEQIFELGRRFMGVDISFRRHGTNWSHPWRIKVVSSKYETVEEFGDTINEAAAKILEHYGTH